MAQIIIDNNSINTGDVLSFSFSGMLPEWYCYVGVLGGGYAQFSTGMDGSNSGAFYITEGPGFYTLRVWDDFGNSAIANFTVGWVALDKWVVIDRRGVDTDGAKAILYYGQEAIIPSWVLIDKKSTVLAVGTQAVIDKWVLIDKKTTTLQVGTEAVVYKWVLIDRKTIKLKKSSPETRPVTDIPWSKIMIGSGAALAAIAAAALIPGKKDNKKKKK